MKLNHLTFLDSRHKKDHIGIYSFSLITNYNKGIAGIEKGLSSKAYTGWEREKIPFIVAPTSACKTQGAAHAHSWELLYGANRAQ